MSDIKSKVDKFDISALQQGNDAAWSEFLTLADELIIPILNWAKWHFSEQTKHDILAHVHSDLPTSLDRFKGNASLTTLIKRITIFKCINVVRSQVRKRAVFSTLSYDELIALPPNEQHDMTQAKLNTFDPVEEVTKLECARLINETLNSLSDKCKEILNLYYMEDLSYKVIAEQLDISANTVGPRLSKCLNKFKNKIEKNKTLRDFFFTSGD